MKQKSHSVWWHGLKSYFLEHLRVAITSVGDVIRNPFTSVFTILTIAVVLLLPTLLHMGLNSAQTASSNLASNFNVTLFLKRDVSEPKALDLRQRLEKYGEIRSVKYISAAQGLKEFASRTGLGTAVDKLPNNPLPATLVITPRTPISEAKLVQLKTQLLTNPEVETVRLDIEWAEKFTKMVLIAKRLGFVVNILLASAVLFVVGNTIRLAIENKKNEIEISRLMGATDRFIRRPFLYTGFLYGFLGATCSWVALSIIVAWLLPPIQTLSKLYNFHIPTGLVPIDIVLILLATGAAVGLVGAWAAFSGHLASLEAQ
jgi:cell division transport system permease protein